MSNQADLRTLIIDEAASISLSDTSVDSVIQALIIDDNPDDREAYIRALRYVSGVEYSFTEAADGPSGLAAIASNTPDVLLLDYSLPGSDGLAVLAQVRETYPFLPVIMLTGQGNEALAVRGIKAGANDYLAKSAVSGAVLHRSILAAIEHHRNARTIQSQSQTIERQRQNLEDSNHFLNSLLNHIPDPIFVKNAAHFPVMGNRAFGELTGAASASAPGDAFWDHDELALKCDQPSVSEQSIADLDGVQRLFSIKRATFSDRTGDKILVGVMRDITVQRQAEDDFKRQAAQMISQSQDLATLGVILEESVQEIVIVDAAKLTILQANKGALQNLGYTEDQIQEINLLDLAPQFTEQQLRKLLQPLVAGEQDKTIYHAAYRRKNGSLYDVEVHTQSTLSRGRKVFVQIAIDETERNRIARMKSEFISKVSHELRTPLTSIRGALGLLNAQTLGKLPEKAAAMVRIADSNAERLARLVNDVLALEKSTSGNLSLGLCKTPVAELLRQAVECHAQYAEKYKVRFVLDEMPSSLTAVADPGRLMQIIANLMSNAAKFSNPGGVITLRAKDQNANIRFEVEDRGCGIPESFRPRVFERFAQADSSISRRYEGSGLGLSIAKDLIEAMGGQIGFTSEAGRGTTFFFQLPKPGREEILGEVRDTAMRVLVCEDDRDLALIMRLVIEQAGFEVHTAGLIREARQKLQDTSFAVMTLDLSLPDADGLIFLQELRSLPATRHMPVVVVSGRAEEARQRYRGDCTSVDWLPKPIDQQILVQHVRKALLRGKELVCTPNERERQPVL
jgi:PAS domain S-box-containing protein